MLTTSDTELQARRGDGAPSQRHIVLPASDVATLETTEQARPRGGALGASNGRTPPRDEAVCFPACRARATCLSRS